MRNITRPTMPLPDLAGDAAQAGLQVVAQPTSGVGAPRPSPENSDIITALSTFHPALNRFMDQKIADNAAEQLALGAKARLTQDGTAPAVMTPEQDPYWQQGYMKQHGLMAGQSAATEMQRQYEESKLQPDFNPDKFFAKFAKDDAAGLNDKDALAGYIPHVTNMEGQLRADFAKTQMSEVRATQDSMLSAGAGQFVKDAIGKPVEVQQQNFEKFVQEQMANNHMTRAEASTAVIREMSLKSNILPPEAFDFLYKPGVGGRAPVDSNGQNGQPLKIVVEAARQQAQVAQASRIKDAAQQVSITNHISMEQALEQDPMSIGDPFKFVREHSGPNEMFTTPDAAAAGAKKIFDAQKKAQDVADKLGMIAKLGHLAPRAFADDPDVKKAMQKSYDGVWSRTNTNDPNSVASTMTTLLKMYENNGILDGKLESMLKNAHTMMQEVPTTGSAPAGETTGPTPEFKMTYDAYKAVMKSNNPSLIQHMPEDARTMFATFSDKLENGASQLDAFRTAKLRSTPEAKQRVSLAWNPAQKNADVQDMSGSFTKYFGNVNNAEDMGKKVVTLAEDKVALTGMDRKSALKQALTEVQATHVYDGVGSYVAVPPGISQDQMGKSLKVYVNEAQDAYKKMHGADLSNYIVQPTLNGANTTYSILDALHTPVVPSKSIDELNQAYSAKNLTDPTSIAAAQNLKADLAQGKVTPEQAQQNASSITDMFSKGRINAREYERLNAMRKAKNEQDFKDSANLFQKPGAFDVPGADQVLSGKEDLHLGAQVPQPGGLNMNVKDYALDALRNNNPDFALTAFGEGLRLSTYKDSGGNRTIGLGYNIDSRKPEQVQQDFARAGITGDRVQAVLDGKESITPKESMRLYEIVKPQYVKIAQSKFGADWDTFPPNVKAVLTDMAYNGGNKLFGPIVDDMKAGNFAEAAKKVTVSYHDTNGKMVLNTRRIALWRGMLAGQSTFEQMISQGA